MQGTAGVQCGPERRTAVAQTGVVCLRMSRLKSAAKTRCASEFAARAGLKPRNLARPPKRFCGSVERPVLTLDEAPDSNAQGMAHDDSAVSSSTLEDRLRTANKSRGVGPSGEMAGFRRAPWCCEAFGQSSRLGVVSLDIGNRTAFFPDRPTILRSSRRPGRLVRPARGRSSPQRPGASCG
jgi:hypothetical protein